MKKEILAIGLLVAFNVGLKAQSEKKAADTIQQHLIELDKKWAAAESKGDTTTINKILASDYVFTGVDGRTGTRDEAVHLKSGETTITNDDYKIKVYGNTAVMMHSSKFKSGDSDGQASAIHVWVKRGKDWQVVAHQWTLNASQPGKAADRSFILACAKASFEPEVHSLYGDVKTILLKLDDDRMGLPERRGYMLLIESDAGAELALFERQDDEHFRVLRWKGDTVGELREQLTSTILANRGIACVGAQSKALVRAKLNLNDLGVIPTPLNAMAAFSHIVRQHEGQYLRMTVFLLC